jgi:membrane-associated HD superfamily phosphohydrolase
LFYVGFYMYQQLHIKNVLATFFGISFPYLLVGGICFLFNDFDNFAQRLPLSISYSADTHIGHIIYLGLLGFVTLFAFVNFISKFSNEKIKTRNTIFFVYILLAGSIVSLFFSTHFFLFEIPFISFFLGILFAQFFSNNTSRFARFLFYAFWAICIIWFLVSFIL